MSTIMGQHDDYLKPRNCHRHVSTARSNPDAPFGLYRGWWITGVCFIMAFYAWGTVFYGNGYYIRHLNAAKGWPVASLSAAVSISWFSGILATLVIGRVIDRVGTRWVAVSGAFLIGGSIALIGQIEALWQLWLLYCLIGIGYPCLATITVSSSILPWFKRRLGIALGLALTGASIGGAFLIPFMVLMAEKYGFSATVAAVGLSNIILVVPLAILILRRPDGTAGGVTTSAATDSAQAALGIRDYLGLPRFWRITAACSLALAAQVGFLTHQIPALQGLPRVDQCRLRRQHHRRQRHPRPLRAGCLDRAIAALVARRRLLLAAGCRADPDRLE